MLNKVMLIGYASADSEMKFTPAGIPVANFSLAVKEVHKNGDGEKRTNTLWIRCVAWRRWGEIVGEHVTRGKFLYIKGRLQLRSYEDREGQKRNVTEVVVTMLRFLGPAKNGNGAKATESSKAADHVDEGDNPFNEPQSETSAAFQGTRSLSSMHGMTQFARLRGAQRSFRAAFSSPSTTYRGFLKQPDKHEPTSEN